MESSYAVRYLLPAESVETFYLLFPDPWPKRRHHRRRLVTPDFLNSVHGALEQNGVVYIATDHLDYFRKIKEAAESIPALQSMTLMSICLRANLRWLSGKKARQFTGWRCEKFRR